MMADATKKPVLKKDCDVQQVLDLIADKWTTLVVHTLSRETRRYSQLKREIEGISQKMLTQTLRRLEKDGLISRKVYPVVPPMVEYSLTPLGLTLIKPLKALCQWAEDHFHEVEGARTNVQSGSKSYVSKP
jgi:DNA-binding HxlR family transcriptional regulator